MAACPKIVHTRTVVRRAPHAPSAASAPRSNRAAGTQLPRWLVRNCRRHCSHSNATVAQQRDVDARATVAAEAQRAHRSAQGEAVTTAERPRWQQQSWLTAFAGGGRREQDGEAADRHGSLALTRMLLLLLDRDCEADPFEPASSHSQRERARPADRAMRER